MIQNPEAQMKALLEKHATRKITTDELQAECAYWYLGTFDSFHPKPMPTPPSKYTEFKNMSYDRQIKMKDEFYQRFEIKEYLDMKGAVQAENYSQTQRLKELINYIPEQDIISKQKYRDKINEFINIY